MALTGVLKLASNWQSCVVLLLGLCLCVQFYTLTAFAASSTKPSRPYNDKRCVHGYEANYFRACLVTEARWQCMASINTDLNVNDNVLTRDKMVCCGIWD